jgi:hypothetical protein
MALGEFTADVREGFATLKKALDILGRGPFDFYVEKLTGCYDLLIKKYAPFKVGDRVELTETPTITKSEAWGWLSAKHFLVKGAIGKVVEVDVDGDGFTAYVQFEEDSWIEGRTGRVNPTPSTDRGNYGFRERWLRRIITPEHPPARPEAQCTDGCKPEGVREMGQ